MHYFSDWRGWSLLLIAGTLGLINPGISVDEAPQQINDDEQICEVFGKPVFRRDVVDDFEDQHKLHQVMLQPVLRRYQAAHRKELESQPSELDAAMTAFETHQAQASEAEPIIRQAIEGYEEQLKQKDLDPAQRASLLKSKLNWERMLPPKESVPWHSIATRIGRDIHRAQVRSMLVNRNFQKHLYENYGGGRILWQQGGSEAFDAMRNWIEARDKAKDFQVTDEKLRAQLYEYWTTHDHGTFLIRDPERIKVVIEREWTPQVDLSSRR